MANKKNEAAAKTESIENTAVAAAASVPTEVIPEAKKAASATEIPAAETPKRRGRKPAASKADAPAETKKKTTARGRKSAAAKKDVAAESKTKAPKEEAPLTEAAPVNEKPKKRGRKPAAAKAEAPAETAKKPAARGRKNAAAKNTGTAAGKGGRKKAVTRDSLIKAAEKKIGAANLAKIKYPIAVNIELDGAVDKALDDRIFYINISDGKIDIKPFKYNDYDVYIRADADELMKVFSDKKNIYDALADGLIKVDGNTKKAILFIHACL